MTQAQEAARVITREPVLASRSPYDLIVIGGGIYGVMMLFEATRRKLRTLLIEGEDFGSGTSFNWLRILHGGFRYLQHADLLRFYESVAERSWFLRTFPQLAHPLPCLMPLYGKGLRRPSILRMAVRMNDLLSINRNHGLQAGKRIPGGRVISRDETLARAPGIRRDGLKGGVVWYDALLPESPILIKEILRWCVGQGATALNYTAARSMLLREGQVSGVETEDLHLHRRFAFYSPKVVNAAGPWCRQVSALLDRDRSHLFAYSKAWNVLFDHPAPAECGLAVAPDQPGARTYFLLPWKGRLLAGTGHAAVTSIEEGSRPTNQELAHFISDINSAVPGLRLAESGVYRVLHGFLPAVCQGSIELADRAVFLDHGRQGGPQGLFSISGVKFTAARRVAEKTVRRLFPKVLRPETFDSRTWDKTIQTSLKRSIFSMNSNNSHGGQEIRLDTLEEMVKSESVVHLHDLVFRRTNLWEHPELALTISARLGRHLLMDERHLTKEIQFVERLLKEKGPAMVSADGPGQAA